MKMRLAIILCVGLLCCACSGAQASPEPCPTCAPTPACPPEPTCPPESDPQVIERIVKETVIVEKIVEKEVIVEKIVEKEVTVIVEG